MSQATPTLRIFAVSLIGHEALMNSFPLAKIPTAFPVTERMRPVVANYVGKSGYHALIFRALVMARDEVPWLCDVKIAADGSLYNFDELSDRQDSADAAAGSEVLLARLFELLVAFIGEILTLRLVQELWPSALDDPEFPQPSSHESLT